MHTERQKHDKRRHVALLNVGTFVTIPTHDGPAIGFVDMTDDGGWIYVHWFIGYAPEYLRATQVTPLPDDEITEDLKHVREDYLGN